MSDSDSSGFGKFVPGFDFLQNLAKGASASVPQMPNMGNWVAPTLNVEELDKRIEELKNVQFWLEQNSRALSATIQALEVQKMTLATLKGMNFNLGDVANAFKLKAADTVASTVHKATEKAAATAETVGDIAGGASKTAAKAAQAATGGLVDPLQLIHGAPKAGQHAYQQERQPQLQNKQNLNQKLLLMISLLMYLNLILKTSVLMTVKKKYFL